MTLPISKLELRLLPDNTPVLMAAHTGYMLADGKKNTEFCWTLKEGNLVGPICGRVADHTGPHVCFTYRGARDSGVLQKIWEGSAPDPQSDVFMTPLPQTRCVNLAA